LVSVTLLDSAKIWENFWCKNFTEVDLLLGGATSINLFNIELTDVFTTE